MNLDKLSWRAKHRLGQYAHLIGARAFDSDDVELFLVYAREAFIKDKGSVIADFANTLAHSIRNKGKLQEATADLNDLTHDELMAHPRRPLGEKVYIDEEKLRTELDQILGAFGCDAITQDAFDEIKACLCIISNQTLLERDGIPMGVLKLMVVDDMLSLDVKPYGKKLQVVMLNAPVTGFEGRVVDFGEHGVSATRPVSGEPLEIVHDGAALDLPSKPGQTRVPTAEEVQYAQHLKSEIANLLRKLAQDSKDERQPS